MTLKDKVLAVDDDPTNLKIYEEVLKDQCHLKVASTGEEALQQIPRFKPDIVLLDIMMPGIDGYETCQKIKNDPDLKFTKILMVSAKAMTNDRLAGYGTGADDYITKPFNDDELLAKVKVYLKLKF
ncbi:MAG: response regulator, partial [Candidatus Omnitrophica bacterium]|nr:response regulator [Candidatus Omnitrophota bacterium]